MTRYGLAASLAALVAACGGGLDETPPRAPPPLASAPRVAPSLERVVRACAARVACDEGAGSGAIERCVAALVLRADDGETGCLASARSCGEVVACGGGDAGEAARRACDSRPQTLVFCDGARLVSCEGDRAQLTDCASLGGVCRELRIASGVVARGCYAPGLCKDGAPPRRCDGGGRVVSCQDGLADQERCGAGTRCEERAGPGGVVEARCEPIGAAPCVSPRARCDGATLISCVPIQGRSVRVETRCNDLGLSCVEGEGPSGPSAARCAQPSGADGPAWCEGSRLRLSAAGVPVRVDCGRIGFGSCTVKDGVAACRR